MTTVLFFDDWLLSRRVDLVRRLGKPKWVPEGTLDEILCDGTWNRPTVFRGPDDGKWRVLYNGVTYENGERVVLGMMLAESDDGIHWTKPDLSGRVDFPNRRLPNQVFLANCGGPAYFDPRDPDPERRLKFLYSAQRSFSDLKGQYLLTSPDGITWKHAGKWGERSLDAPISIFYHERRGTYVISNRPINADRRVAFIETKDFVTFTEPHTVMYPGPEDPPLTEFYGMTVFPYEGMYVGLLLVTHADPSLLDRRASAVDGALAYSYNGWNFNRAFHVPFVPRNDRDQPGGGGIYPSCLVRDESNTLRIYSGGSRAGHFHLKEPLDSAVMLHTLRLDGFMYLEPNGLKGSLTTRPLRFKGSRLQLNVRAPYGCVRAQFVERSGKPVPGLSFDESVPFAGDELFYTPVWTSGKTPADVAGQDAHLEIELTNAEIYAIRGDFDVVVGHGLWPSELS